jgi:hypothetical protein
VAIGKPDETGNIPQGAPGRPGYRPDLMRPVIDSATGQPIQGTNKYTKQLRDGPEGLVEVYAPSPAFRQQLDRRADQQRTRRLATRAGYNPMQAADMATGQPPNLDRLRAQGDAMRDAEKADRQQAVIRRAQAQNNPLEYMNRDDIGGFNQMVAADAMLRRGYRGATPLDVEAEVAKAEALQQLRMSLGQGAQTSPASERLMDAKVAEAERARPATERAALYRDNPAMHESELQMVDDYVAQRFSAPRGMWGTSSFFLPEEQDKTVAWLTSQGYTPEKAQALVANVLELRQSQSYVKERRGLQGDQ